MVRESGQEAQRTRARILEAAAEIARAGAGARVSVRAVAARAGVGVGTLRYHFPTQRELLDAVLAAIYEEAMPDDRIRDTALPARERLLGCLRQLLAPVGVDERARETWAELFRTFIDPAAPEDVREGYLELERHARRRVESWLSILTEEGALAPGDTTLRARILLTTLNGLAVQRALPSQTAALDLEAAVLEDAVDRLLR